MGMCALGRLYYATLCFTKRLEGETPQPPEAAWTYGCVRARRREEAITVQLVTAARLKKQGVSALTGFHDASNVFMSVDHESVIAASLPPFTRCIEDHSLVEQRIRRATVRITDAEVDCTMLASTGVWPGDTLVMTISTHYPLVAWLACCLAGWLAGRLGLQDRPTAYSKPMLGQINIYDLVVEMKIWQGTLGEQVCTKAM